MPTECSAKGMGFAPVDGRRVVADFAGGAITSNAGALLLGATDRAIGLTERFAGCFVDGRASDRVVHDVSTLVGQRVLGIALGYEDLVDHDRLRPSQRNGGRCLVWCSGGSRPDTGVARRWPARAPSTGSSTARPGSTAIGGSRTRRP